MGLQLDQSKRNKPEPHKKSRTGTTSGSKAQNS